MPIGRKALELLSALAEANGALVTKDELMAAVWPNAIVEENAIQVQIAALRRSLGPDAALLRTVHGLGYRLDAAVALPATPLALPSKPSIAVMPLANLSGAADQEYFADGMVEEIVASLARFKSIFVIGSGSTFSLKGRALTPQEAGRLLGVRYVLNGSVRRAGGRVRIAVNLTDAADGSQVFVDRFEEALEDVFALQDKVALAVAGQIEPAVQGADLRRVSGLPAESLDSYELYLRAWALERTFAKSNVMSALELLGRATAIAPDFAPALALAAICHRVVFNLRWSDDPERSRQEGLGAASRALKTGSDDATVLANVASCLTYLDPSPDVAIDLLDRAMTLNPGSATVWFYSGVSRLQIGETDLGIEHLEHALRLEPRGPVRPHLIGFLGHGRFQQGRFAEAAQLVQVLVQETDSPRGYAFLAASLGRLGRSREAGEALARFEALTPQRIDDFAGAHLRNPKHFALFMEGIALATNPSVTL
jgi:TolB-like protein